MKIKKFKQFTYNSDIDSILQDVEDIFDYIRDYGFLVEVEKYTDLISEPVTKLEEEISIKISNPDKSTFIVESDDEKSSELKDCILRIQNIMKDWRLQMEVKFKLSDSGYSPLLTKDVKIDDDRFVYAQPLVFDEDDEYGFDYDEELVDIPVLIIRIFFTRVIEKNLNLKYLHTKEK